ncbi:DUF6042 family protein [Streptomyces violascens]|uniref:DUF6042 family protein n=1 Tax=Streptomyces violascens TaxID=67381 RepID=UPI003659DD6C
MSLHSDWFLSLWSHVLPRSQSFLLCMIPSTAAVRELRGSLDNVVSEICGDPSRRCSAVWGKASTRRCCGWSPMIWRTPGTATKQPKSGPRPNSVGVGVKARGLPSDSRHHAAPRTIRDLAEVMVGLGITERGSGGVWAVPGSLPWPELVLDLPADFDARLREIRAHQAAEPAKQALIAYLAEDQDYPAELLTSLERLGRPPIPSHDDLRQDHLMPRRQLDSAIGRVRRFLPRRRGTAMWGAPPMTRAHTALSLVRIRVLHAPPPGSHHDDECGDGRAVERGQARRAVGSG